MLDKFDELIISRTTVESIGQQEIGQMMVGFTWRSDVWQPHKLIKVISIQVIGAAILFAAMMLPIDRALNTDRPSQSQSDRLAKLIWVDGTITLATLGGVNSWIFYRGKRLKKLLKLVEQIEQYNRIVNSIATLEKLTNLTNYQCEPSQADSMMEILARTRQNLLIALKIDLYLRQHLHADELIASITHNLIDLQNLAQQPQLVEYGMLLTQAWEIGMSVYHETNIEE